MSHHRTLNVTHTRAVASTWEHKARDQGLIPPREAVGRLRPTRSVNVQTSRPHLVVAIVTVLAVCLVWGAPTTALVAMRLTGKGWARARIASYLLTALVQAPNAMSLVERAPITAAVCLLVAILAARGAWSTWQAWRQGDYRPKYLRKGKAADGTPVTKAEPQASH
jgi:hypothetical protein